MKKSLIIIVGILVVLALVFVVFDSKKEFVKDVPCDGPPDVCLKEIVCDDGFKTEDIEVCGKINVQCITTPCNPVEETFSNRCEARKADAFDIDNGACLVKTTMSEKEAREIVINSSECSVAGVSRDNYSYDALTKTWRVDLMRMPELEQDGCSPVCVVFEETKTAEVDWQCVGLLKTLRSNASSEQANLVAVDGSDSSGSAYRLIEGNKLYHFVRATLPELVGDNKYEGWLVQSSPLKFFSTGIMQLNENNEWVLEYESNEEFSTYLQVVITLETKVDAIPEKHIIEGSF